MRIFLLIGAISGFIAVALGAFAAHGLSDQLDARMLDVFKTGSEYQLTHSLALIAVALLINFSKNSEIKSSDIRTLKVSGWSLVIGLVLFPFSLYCLALTGLTWLGAITPLGGLAFLVGWAGMALYAAQYKA